MRNFLSNKSKYIEAALILSALISFLLLDEKDRTGIATLLMIVAIFREFFKEDNPQQTQENK
jgi:hypothetical protein